MERKTAAYSGDRIVADIRDGSRLPERDAGLRGRVDDAYKVRSPKSLTRYVNPELAKLNETTLQVLDDFPQAVQVLERELNVIETYLGALLDQMLGVAKAGEQSGPRQAFAKRGIGNHSRRRDND
jgi:hypothetical protein